MPLDAGRVSAILVVIVFVFQKFKIDGDIKYLFKNNKQVGDGYYNYFIYNRTVFGKLGKKIKNLIDIHGVPKLLNNFFFLNKMRHLNEFKIRSKI